MNRALKQISVAFTMLAVVLAFTVPIAQACCVAPQFVRLTGTFYRPGEKSMEPGGNTFTVYTQYSKWILRVQKAESPGMFDWQVLQNTLPRSFYLLGPKDLIASLQNPIIAGRAVTVEGYFETNSDNIINVTAIANVAK